MLALSAGGDRAALHLGMINGLLKKDSNRVKWTHFAGISAGALVAAEVSQYSSAEDFHARVLHMSTELGSGNQIVHPWVWPWLGSTINGLWAIFFHRTLFKSDLPSLINQNYDATAVAKHGHVLKVGAYNKTKGQYQSFSTSDDGINMCKAISASASVPLVFPSVKIDGSDFEDGGVSHVLPTEEIIDYYKTETGDIDVLLAYPTDIEEFMKSEVQKSRFGIFTSTEEVIAERLYDNMQTDLSMLSAALNIPMVRLLRKNMFKLGHGRTLRFYKPQHNKYSSFTHIKKEDITRMIRHGEEIVK